MKDLSEKERRAITLLMRGQGRLQILRDLGYTRSYTNHHGCEWWNKEHIKLEISRRRARMAKRTEITTDWIADRLKAIVESDVAAIIDQEGRAVPLHSLDPSLRKTLSVTIKNGSVAIKQNDRLKALDQLAKLQGLYEEKIKLDGEVTLVDRLLEGRKRAALDGKD